MDRRRCRAKPAVDVLICNTSPQRRAADAGALPWLAPTPTSSIPSGSCGRSWGGPGWCACRACGSSSSAPAAIATRGRPPSAACLCGREGRLTFDDPAKEGLQYDPRSRPLRHPDRTIRLQQIARLHDPFGHQKAAREDLPQREKPRHDPRPRYVLKPMPFRTLGEALAAGLVVKVYCRECRRHARPDLPPAALNRCFARPSFRCQRVVQRWPTMAARVRDAGPARARADGAHPAE